MKNYTATLLLVLVAAGLSGCRMWRKKTHKQTQVVYEEPGYDNERMEVSTTEVRANIK